MKSECDDVIGTVLSIERIVVAGWYDGVVTSVLTLSGETESKLCFLIAWSIKQDVRIYGFVPLQEPERLITAIQTSKDEEGWLRIQKEIRQGFSSHTGTVRCIVCKRLEFPVLACRDLAIEPTMLVEDEEEAREPVRFEKWLRMVDPSNRVAKGGRSP